MPMLTYKFMNGVSQEVGYALAILAIISFIALCVLAYVTYRNWK